MKTSNYSGPAWKSNTLNQTFILLSDHETVEFGLTENALTDRSRIFKGKKAIRINDEKSALIDLTKKPITYPYDFVLL